MSRALAIVVFYMAAMAIALIVLSACTRQPDRTMDWKALADYLDKQERKNDVVP